MLKIRALNRESSSDEDVPVIRREAQEEIALELYNKALRLQANKNYTESEEILLKLVQENIPLLEDNGGLPKSMSTLKFSCFLNLGNIYLQNDNNNRALENYLTASELDSTDVTLWYKIGKLALKVNKFRQSAYAFSKGLECSESHWPCLDQLITILFGIKDTIGCLMYISKALMLDEYYTKGLVLRKQIYLNNPATKEYYQQYNPDYIYEPPLNVEIDENDEKEILAEVQVLIDRISVAEKELDPKPLSTIPLPKPLENFTWLALANTIIYLHQYLTDNEMTHFTMVDLSKCMSQPNIEIPPIPVTTIDNIENVEKSDIRPPESVPETNEEDNMEVDSIPERRFSQNSDNNNEVQENTPIQTDNDDEQPTEQENEEPDDNSEPKTDKNNRSRGAKRRRDLVSELQIWGWHSKRKYAKKGKQDKDFSVEDAFNRIIPNNLLKDKITDQTISQIEDSMNTMDLYKSYMENNNIGFLSPIHSPQSINSLAYFDTEREKEDVQQFWKKSRDYCDAVVLIKELVFALAELWNIKWPKELVVKYIEAYNMFSEHYDPPQLFCEETPFEQIRLYALATLLYGELLNFSSESADTIHVTLLSYLQMISGWHVEWKKEYESFFNRVYWLRAHLFIKENNNDLAIRSLQLIQEIICDKESQTEDKYLLNLPNCFKYGLINSDITQKILKHLDLVTSLSTVEELYNAEKYHEVANIIKTTFNSVGNYPQVGRIGRPAQLGLLLHSLWFTDMTECFIWNEVCLNEAVEHFLKPLKDCLKWELIVEKCLAIFHEIIKSETVSIFDCLNDEEKCRLVKNLIKIIRRQLGANSKNIPLSCITPWILLHYILVREEHRQQANKKVSHVKTDKPTEMNEENDNKELPPSVAILFSAHEFLGPKSWCLTSHGELLHFILDTVLDRLDTPIFEPLRDKIDIHIEQALFCLYQHPSKNNKISRHLADHNVDPLSLTWERSFQLYEFYGPDCLPEFNSYKNASISSDLEQLLKRIVVLVPNNCDPKTKLPKIIDYIHGRCDSLPGPMDFPNKIRAIYYLIADSYFKQRQFKECLKYFQMDLCINPLRLDSWACMGLSYVSQLENKLNYCKAIKNENDFLDKAKSAQICFRKALELCPDHLMLWIEFGSFEYMVHSFCSRLLKHESENFSMEKFEFLENQKNNFLDSSGSSFEKAISLYELENENEQDERWLQYYILGKIAEKKQKEPTEYLQYYVTAFTLLHENNAVYPEKINYYTPQHLAVEALELHYRIHASILKYIELHEGKTISNRLGTFFKKCLNSTNVLKNSTQKTPDKPVEQSNKTFQNEFVNTIKSGDNERDKNITEDVKNTLEDILVKVEVMVNESKIVDKDVEIIETVEDVIMISDSDEEKEHETKAVNVKPKIQVKDIQTLLDEMMVETMKTAEEPVDSDVSCNEIKDEGKLAKESEENNKIVEKKLEEKKPPDSETDTDNIRTSVDETSSSSTTSSSSSSSSETESDDESSSSSSTTSSENDNMSSNEILQLVDRCINGLEVCVMRLPQNYKALYRLAHLYFNYKSKKDSSKCRQLLLGEYKCKDGSSINGLFSSRKNTDFFNGIWRIPSSEIDRPGSLSAHMSRCVSLLLQVLRATNDNKTLIELALQLRKTPDPDKIYIKDSERLQFSEQAMFMCTQSIRAQMKNLATMTNPQLLKLLQEIFKIYQRAQKHMPIKDNVFATMLQDVYKSLMKDKLVSNANILEAAIKFCQQNRPVNEKPKTVPVQTQSVTQVTNIPSSSSPAQSSSPNIVPQLPTPPLKRPGSGRPRGRPPLPKIPGQPRIPRGRSPSATVNPYSSMFNNQFTYEYLKHYQEQLIKQYSQSLSLQQLTQLTQYLTQGQIPNPLQTDSLTNPFLNNPNSLLTSMSPTTTSSNMQLLDTLRQVNPNLMKNLNMDQLLGSSQTSLAAQLKYYNSLHAPSTSGISTTTNKSVFQQPNITQQPAAKKIKTHQTQPKTVPSLSQTKTVPILNQSKAISSLAQQKSISSLNQTKSISSLSQSKTISSLSQSKPITTMNPTVPVPKYSPAELSKLKMPPITTKSSQIFKEPVYTKKPSPVPSPSTSTNILMKERPNISITPVTTTTTSPSFAKPLTTTSPNKTLQEKLADKQKQQLNKQLNKNIEANIFAKNAPLPSDVLMKSLNLATTLPSSLTVSKAQVPNASIYTIDSNSKKAIQSSALYANELARNLPPSINVSKTLATPSFPAESGISISQIPSQRSIKPAEISPIRKEPPKPPSGLFSDIKILQTKRDKSVPKPPPKQISPPDVIIKPRSSRADLTKNTHETFQKEMNLLYSQMSIEQINNLMMNSDLRMAGPSKASKKYDLPTSYKTCSLPSTSKSTPTVQMPKKPTNQYPSKHIVYAKKDHLPKQPLSLTKTSTSSNEKKTISEDVICIDD